jgi:hypothetical protein
LPILDAGHAGQAVITAPVIISTVASVISIAIAIAALLVSRRAYRSSNELQLLLAERPGRLYQVTTLLPDRHKRIGYGFKILNGPAEVTVSSAFLYLTYKCYRQPTIQSVDTCFELAIRPAEFSILGLSSRSGKEFEFGLGPSGTEAWRFPYELPDVPAEIEDGKRKQQIVFRFAVTASEDTKDSDSIVLGDSGPVTLLRQRIRYTKYAGLETVLLNALAKNAIRTIRSGSAQVQLPPVLEGLVRHNDAAEGLQSWLVEAWREGGRFGDEQTERLARMLADPTTADLGFKLLAEYAGIARQDQSPPAATGS